MLLAAKDTKTTKRNSPSLVLYLFFCGEVTFAVMGALQFHAGLAASESQSRAEVKAIQGGPGIWPGHGVAEGG